MVHIVHSKIYSWNKNTYKYEWINVIQFESVQTFHQILSSKHSVEIRENEIIVKLGLSLTNILYNTYHPPIYILNRIIPN